MIADRVWHAIITYKPTIKGRASRRQLIATIVISWAIGALLMFIVSPAEPRLAGQDSAIVQWVMAANVITTSLPMLAAIVRRFHDSDRSPLDSLWIVLIPYLGWLVFFAYLLWEGDRFENSYGPDPRLTSLW